jgi:hypothetical protein
MDGGRTGRWRGCILDLATELDPVPLERAVNDAAKLLMPLCKQRVNDFEVDFFWPELGLVVETDGLRYHRIPSAQVRDARRDRAHVMTGMTPRRRIRF